MIHSKSHYITHIWKVGKTPLPMHSILSNFSTCCLNNFGNLHFLFTYYQWNLRTTKDILKKCSDEILDFHFIAKLSLWINSLGLPSNFCAFSKVLIYCKLSQVMKMLALMRYFLECQNIQHPHIQDFIILECIKNSLPINIIIEMELECKLDASLFNWFLKETVNKFTEKLNSV